MIVERVSVKPRQYSISARVMELGYCNGRQVIEMEVAAIDGLEVGS